MIKTFHKTKCTKRLLNKICWSSYNFTLYLVFTQVSVALTTMFYTKNIFVMSIFPTSDYRVLKVVSVFLLYFLSLKNSVNYKPLEQGIKE